MKESCHTLVIGNNFNYIFLIFNIMDKQKNPSSRSLSKKIIREKRLKELAIRLRSNIKKRKQNKKK